MQTAIESSKQTVTQIFLEKLERLLCSANHPIRSRQHVRRNYEADLLGGFQVDYQLELGGLLDGKVGGFCPFQNLIHIDGGALVQVGEIGPVGHETASLHKQAERIYRRQSIFCRELRDLHSTFNGNSVRQYDHSLWMSLTQSHKGIVDLIGSGHVLSLGNHLQSLSRRLDLRPISLMGLGLRNGENADAGDPEHRLPEQLHPLPRKLFGLV